MVAASRSVARPGALCAPHCSVSVRLEMPAPASAACRSVEGRRAPSFVSGGASCEVAARQDGVGKADWCALVMPGRMAWGRQPGAPW